MSPSTPDPKHYKSHSFSCSASWQGDRIWNIDSPDKITIPGGPPPAFQGSPDKWSPEELLLAGVNSCHLASFISYTARKGFDIISYESDIEGILEHDGDGYRFTRMTLKPKIRVKSRDDIDTARQYLDRAHKMCFMARSVNAEIFLEPDIDVA